MWNYSLSLGLTPRATDFPEIPLGTQQTEGMQKAGLLGTLEDSGFIACWFLLLLFFKVLSLGPLTDLSSLGGACWGTVTLARMGRSCVSLKCWKLLSFYVSLSTVTSRTHEHKAVSLMILIIAISP